MFHNQLWVLGVCAQTSEFGGCLQRKSKTLHKPTDEMVSHSSELHHILQITVSEDFPAACV